MESFDVNLHRLLSKKTLLKDAVVTPEEVIPMPGGVGVKGGFNDDQPIKAKEIDKLSWQQFEALVVEVMAKQLNSDSMYLTQSGNDFGADGVILSANTLHLIQVKHTTSKSYKGGYKAITEVYAAGPKYETLFEKEKTELLFITNATRLSKQAKDAAKESNVQILNGNLLTELVEKHEITFKQVMTRLDKKRLKV
jgi:HJR/Mrr/RecB family endonuclease